MVRKEVLNDLAKTIEILEKKEEKDIEELKILSDHAVEDVALHKDLDLISVTVLIYSLYKIIKQISEPDYQALLSELKFAKISLEEGQLGEYNKNIKSLFQIVKRANARVREHLADVMHAARIKKGTVLLSKGLSLGQAAGLMGLTNWDLQQYASRTLALELGKEVTSAKKRVETAWRMFNL